MRTSINEDKCPEFFAPCVPISVIGCTVASGRARMESSGHFGVDSDILLFFCAPSAVFFWTSLYCLIYALNGFQTFFDLPRAPNNALMPFSVFVGVGILVLFFAHIGWANLGRDVWTFIWLCALYEPITILIAGAQNDR